MAIDYERWKRSKNWVPLSKIGKDITTGEPLGIGQANVEVPGLRARGRASLLARDLGSYMSAKRSALASSTNGAQVNVVPPMRNQPLPGQSSEEPAIVQQASGQGGVAPMSAYERMRNDYARFSDPEAAKAFGAGEKKRQLEMTTGGMGVGTVAPSVMATARGQLGGIIGAEQAAAAKSAGEEAASRQAEAEAAGLTALGIPAPAGALRPDIAKEVLPQYLKGKSAEEVADIEATAKQLQTTTEAAAKIDEITKTFANDVRKMVATGQSPNRLDDAGKTVVDKDGNPVINPAHKQIISEAMDKLDRQGLINTAKQRRVMVDKLANQYAMADIKAAEQYGEKLTTEQVIKKIQDARTAIESAIPEVGEAPEPAAAPPPAAPAGEAVVGAATPEPEDLNKDGTTTEAEKTSAIKTMQNILADYDNLPPEQQAIYKNDPKVIWAMAVKGRLTAKAKEAAEITVR